MGLCIYLTGRNRLRCDRFTAFQKRAVLLEPVDPDVIGNTHAEHFIELNGPRRQRLVQNIQPNSEHDVTSIL